MATGPLPLQLLVVLLATYCYRVPSVLAIPEKKVVYAEDGDWPVRRDYRLEDFLWTGSGDGALPSNPSASWRTVVAATTTVFRTTTVLTTVFPPTPTLVVVTASPVAPPPAGTIQPTSTQLPVATSAPAALTPPPSNATAQLEPRFWLLTVLKQPPGKASPSTQVLEERLARLYRIAFDRRQELHLGLSNSSVMGRLRRPARAPEPLWVKILEVSSRDPGNLRLLYSVHVGGQPVVASVAAEDMSLVSNAEVTAELGMPVVTKAEPFLHASPQGWKSPGTGYTWLLVGAGVAALCLLLLLVILLALGLGKKKRGKRRVVQEGASNEGYHHGEADQKVEVATPGPSTPRPSPRFHGVAPPPCVTFQEEETQTHRISSSTSSSSQESLVRRRAHPGRTSSGNQSRHRHHHTHSHRQSQLKKRSRTTQQADDADSGQATLPEGSTEELLTRSSPPTVVKISRTVSPNSFLSMPSIKAFPRGANIPEPLARVLEPVSVRHLDCEAGGVLPVVRRLTRHGSVEGEDPGIVGPLVWELHCRQLQQQQGCMDENVEDLIGEEIEEDLQRPDTTGSNAGRMRRRFHELLDDAFSLFGSRSESPGMEEDSSSPPTLHRVHSAIVKPVGELPFETTPRPHTSEIRRPATAASVTQPRGAWGTVEHSPMSGRSGSTLPRPLSAGPFHRPQLPTPEIDRTFILCDSKLTPNDPAVPLIAAIKEELKKFQSPQKNVIPLPGSTSKS